MPTGLDIGLRPEFKKGDVVRGLSGDRTFTVASVPGMSEYDCRFYAEAHRGFVRDDGTWDFREGYELVGRTADCAFGAINKTNKTIMEKVSNGFKLFTDKKTQTLKKAGFINGDLEMTDEGVSVLLNIILAEKKDELVAKAEELLQEEKEAKK